MSPEFLREGVAVEDFLNPDRVIIGANDKGAGDLLADIYSKFNCPILRVNIKTAEMIKYASNAFLATKISYINEIGNICKNLGIDVYDVAKGMSLDHRISKYFLNAGLGFGGSCLPKDLRALIHKSKEMGYEPLLLESVIKVNEYQPKRMLEIAKNKIGSFKGKNVAILGAAFKAETDDIRESPAIHIIDSLLGEDAIITLYDPKANNNMKRIYKERIRYAETAKEALKNADLALIITDWKEFELLDFSDMRERIVIDGRRIIKRKIKKIKDRGKEEGDIEYEGLCW
ncbi:MAG: UDP-glucose/GDP-mannose dehydrogenase family protein [Candidatus Altiarchaeales archaeon]|nr:MAG: UDP-glucose/GDP-mannose dehydrogenase family protein [Candidatus Altiarchaeales archaeon]